MVPKERSRYRPEEDSKTPKKQSNLNPLNNSSKNHPQNFYGAYSHQKTCVFKAQSGLLHKKQNSAVVFF
jgi:hypothetical protein